MHNAYQLFNLSQNCLQAKWLVYDGRARILDGVGSFEIVPAQTEHLEQAAELFCAGYAQLRRTVPVAPPKYENPVEILPQLRWLHERHPIVAAVQDGHLIGYLGGMRVSELKGKDKGVYCPEWGHAVSVAAPAHGAGGATSRRRVYNLMYEAIGETWVGEGRLNQAITILAHDKEALDVWFWSGFGMLVVDVVRGLHPVSVETSASASTSAGSMRVRTASPEDTANLLPVFQEHELYYNRSPVWLPKSPMEDDSELAGLLTNPNVVIWMAEDARGEVLGFMQGSLGATDACLVVRDDDTVACTGAYVLPAARRAGTGALLLRAMVDWAREHGHTRISLDFESANIYGSAFWLRHLTPVCYSVLRHVNDHIVPAG